MTQFRILSFDLCCRPATVYSCLLWMTAPAAFGTAALAQNYPIKDFAPVVLVASQPNVLVVHPSLPVTSVRQLIALAKARPGQLNYSGSGMGAAAHLAAELFKSMTGTDIVHISYKSAGPALTDLIAGQTQLMFATSLSVMPYVKANRVRALAVTTAKRVRVMPISYCTLPSLGKQAFHEPRTTGS